MRRPPQQDKKGFTIVEAVVAMALTTLVTVVTLTLCAGALRSTALSHRRFVAENYCADVVCCYKAALLREIPFADALLSYDETLTTRATGETEVYTAVREGITYTVTLETARKMLEVKAEYNGGALCRVRFRGGDYA